MIKRVALKKGLVYSVLVMAVLNAVLRFSNSGATTLYRLVSPPIVLYIVATQFRKFAKSIAFFMALLVYSCIVSLLFYAVIPVEYILFSIYIFTIYVLVKYCQIIDKDFERNFFAFIHIITLITIGASILQYFTRYTLPYLKLPAYRGVNVYMSNENELGEAFACVFILYVFLIVFRKKIRLVLPTAFIVFFLFIGDVKLSIIGVFVAVLLFVYIYLFWYRNCSCKSIVNFLLWSVLLLFIFIMLLYLINPTVIFRDYSITLKKLIIEPVKMIVSGKSMNSAGSINDRTNAIVYGMKELKKTYFFGIGFGNSVNMLKKPEYHLATAKSMHNILFQFLTELGYFAVFVYVFILKKIISGLIKKKYSSGILFAVYCIAFVFISSQSSIGILSNYYTIIVTCYVGIISSMDNHFFCIDKNYV